MFVERSTEKRRMSLLARMNSQQESQGRVDCKMVHAQV